MKKKHGFVLRRLGNDAVIVAESVGLIDFDRLISLNESAAYIWQSLPDSDFDTVTVTALLTGRYDVDDSVAGKDAQALLDLWKEAGIIE